MNDYLKKKRSIAIAIILLFIASLALSAAYISIESGHSCVELHCHVCAHLEAAQGVFHSLSAALLMMALCCFASMLSTTLQFRVNQPSFPSTPISWNVRMNN